MTRVAVATAALLTVSSVSAAAQENSGQRDGRYDARIQKRVTEELADRKSVV